MLFTYEHDIAAYKYGLSTFPLNVKNNLAGDEVTDGHLFSSHFWAVHQSAQIAASDHSSHIIAPRCDWVAHPSLATHARLTSYFAIFSGG